MNRYAAVAASVLSVSSFPARSSDPRRIAVGLVGAVVTLAVGATVAQDASVAYPSTRRVNQVDTLHGIKVEDPYRWLEADIRTSDEVAAWVAAQNKTTAAYLASIPEREPIRRRLRELWNYEKISPPHQVAGRFYVFSRNDGLQDHDVVYTAETPDANPRVLLDPNTWARDGTAALVGMAFSEDGKYLAYGVAESGSDWTSWKVLEVGTRRTLADQLKWIKFAGVSWAAGAEGLYYSSFPEPKPGEKYQAILSNQKVYYHRIGTSQGDDALVYERPDRPNWFVNARATGEGRYLVIRLSEGGNSRNSGYVYRDLLKPGGPFVDLIPRPDAIYRFIDNDGPVFYFQTDLDAPRGRVIAIDTRTPGREAWRTVVPEGDATLLIANLIGGRFICNYFKDAHTQLKTFSRDGEFVRELPLPGIGTAGGIDAERSATEIFYVYLSFATPPSVFRHDLTTGMTALWRRPKVKFDPDDYEVKQVFYRSKDGTRVPLFITHRNKALRAISPYHNLKTGVKYPATLVTTADTDDRVVPMHSFKFVAELQHRQAGAAPVLLRVEAGAGHGAAGRPISKEIEEATDRCAFLIKNLGVTVPGLP